jgi:hypothetical protein
MTISLILIGILLPIYAMLDLASYDYFEALMPLSRPWTAPVVYVMILVAAIFAAGTGLILTYQFGTKEPPRRIWLFFSLGWCCWALGEAAGFALRAIYPDDYPVLTINHFLWMFGYVFFAITLFLQLRLIYARKVHINRYHFGAILLGLLVIAAVITLVGTQPRPEGLAAWLAAYFGIFYPLCDFIFGVAALWLAFLFGRGIWARPWWGLIAFAFADGISTWYWAGGFEILTPTADTWLSLFTDTLYISGYVLGALGCLYVFLLNKYSPTLPEEKAS